MVGHYLLLFNVTIHFTKISFLQILQMIFKGKKKIVLNKVRWHTCAMTCDKLIEHSELCHT